MRIEGNNDEVLSASVVQNCRRECDGRHGKERREERGLGTQHGENALVRVDGEVVNAFVQRRGADRSTHSEILQNDEKEVFVEGGLF